MRKLTILTAAILSITFTACKKDRIEQDSFEPMDEFYNENKPEEQEFIITSDTGSGPLIGKDGTEIYISRHLFEDANGQTPSLPYSVKLIELYTFKDMIMYKMASLSSPDLKETAGDIKVRACKDSVDLSLINGKFYAARLNGPHPYTADKKVYQGNHPNDNYGSWSQASDGSNVVDSAGKCLMTLGKVGWSMAANTPNDGDGETIKFTVNGTGGEFIDIFVICENYHGILVGNNLEVTNAPKGETVRIIAMAKNQNGKFVVHDEKQTVAAGVTVTLMMKEKTSDELQQILGSL